MDILYKNINSFFDDLLADLECQGDTKAYIVSIFGKYKNTDFDLSKNSITSLFAQARNKQDFLTYQTLGDWLFFSNTIAPQHLHHASKDYYDTVARLSYYACYKLINRQWKLFEELADRLPILENQVKALLPKLNYQIPADTYIVPFGL
jgi:hypothetical protein